MEWNALFEGTEVLRKRVIALIVDIIASPKRWSRCNIVVNEPHAEGDKSAFL
jgi:hypothetical protein